MTCITPPPFIDFAAKLRPAARTFTAVDPVTRSLPADLAIEGRNAGN